MTGEPSNSILDEIVTVRDWLRYGVSRFNAAGLMYGHGTANATDEAAFLILKALHLPIEKLFQSRFKIGAGQWRSADRSEYILAADRQSLKSAQDIVDRRCPCRWQWRR